MNGSRHAKSCHVITMCRVFVTVARPQSSKVFDAYMPGIEICVSSVLFQAASHFMLL